jgi:hypothetical protein
MALVTSEAALALGTAAGVEVLEEGGGLVGSSRRWTGEGGVT